MSTSLMNKRLALIEETRLAEETQVRAQKNKDPDNPENDAMQSDSKRSKSGGDQSDSKRSKSGGDQSTA